MLHLNISRASVREKEAAANWTDIPESYEPLANRAMKPLDNPPKGRPLWPIFTLLINEKCPPL